MSLNIYKNTHIIIVFFLFTTALISQEKNNDNVFLIKPFDKISKLNSGSKLKKASTFFLNKNWDSTLVYTFKELSNLNNSNIIKDYCHYLRGTSFYAKNLIEQAKKEFNLITQNFDYYNLVVFKLGAIASDEKKYKKAIQYFRKITNENYINNSHLLKLTYRNLGISHLLLGEFIKSEVYLKKSIIDEKDTLKLINKYNYIAHLYYEQYKDDLAIPYFQKAYNLSIRLKAYNSNLSDSELNEIQRKVFNKKRLTSKNMAVVEENRKDYKKALVYRKESEQWKDSLNNQNKIYEVAKKEKEFAVKEKQKEVSLLEAENKIKEAELNILLYSSIFLMLLLSVTGYFYREKVKNNKIIIAQKENLNTLNDTKDKLFSIVSHDLRSSVYALKTSNTFLIDNLENKNIDALPNLLQNNSAILNGAYGLLDNLLNWALLQTEQGYFSIEEIRLFFITEQVSFNYKPLLLEKNLQFINSVSKIEKVFADQESLKIILRNLVDNAIKFSKTNGSIHIYNHNSNEDYCNLIIKDTGLGMSNATRLKLLEDSTLLAKRENENIIGTGLGIQLCKLMIQKNNGKFAIESVLGKGTKMIVSLPKKPING